MKSKKILSLVLAVVMLFTCTSILTSATGEPTTEAAMSYSESIGFVFKKGTKLDRAKFAIVVEADKSKYCAIDGESKDFTFVVDSATLPVTDTEGNTVVYDFVADPDAFFAAFENPEFPGATLTINVTFNFVSDKLFGDFDYVVKVNGVSAPFKTGMDIIDGKLPDTPTPVQISYEGSLVTFPKLNSISVITSPERQDYTDREFFDLTGVSLNVNVDKVVSTSTGSDGKPVYTYGPAYSGVVTYDKTNKAMFTCNPSKDETLTVDDNLVYTYFDGHSLGDPLAITVGHAWSSDYVNITTDKYTEKNPGYHAKVCEGCGARKEAEPHVVDPNVEWVSDDNGTFVENGTEHNFCTVCGAKLTRDTFHTAGYNDAFAELHFLHVIFDYVNALLRIIRSAIGKF